MSSVQRSLRELEAGLEEAHSDKLLPGDGVHGQVAKRPQDGVLQLQLSRTRVVVALNLNQ